MWWKRMLVCLLAAAACLSAPALGQEEPPQEATSPIDPAAGAWITYRGERPAPAEPEPQAFSLRIEYGLPPEASQYGSLVETTKTEFDASGAAVWEKRSLVQTADRSCRGIDGTEEGYWTYWLTPGLQEGDAASVGAEGRLTVDEVEEFDLKGNTYSAVRLRGSGLEVLAEQRTGLVFSVSEEGGETLRVEDTNMLAHYSAWGYSPDEAEVGSRLKALAEEHPDLVEVGSLGRSARGRSIWFARLTDMDSSEEKKNVVMAAALEGDAPEGCAFLLDLLEELAGEFARDDTTAALLGRMNIYAVPMVNPDGIQRWLAMPDVKESALSGSQAPRNGDLVNVNRNFDLEWEEGERNPGNANYAGPAAFSEPESRALRGLLEDVPADLYLSLHSGPDLIAAPWNWSVTAASNPETAMYESILSDLSHLTGLPTRVGAPPAPFTGSSADWAYEGKGASSPICFEIHMHRPHEVDAAEDEDNGHRDPLPSYSAHREAVRELLQGLHSYLAVDIVAPEMKVEVNVPIDVAAEVVVSGRRALPNARVRLVLPEDSSLRFSSTADKEFLLGDLEPASTTRVVWKLESGAGGTNTAAIVLTSSYPEYENIPGTYSAEVEVSVSTQRTWLVLILLSVMVLLVLGLILLSMRKHRRDSGQQP